MSASKRMIFVKATTSDNDDQNLLQECDSEYISTDDAGSPITYIEEYTGNENGSESEDGAYFVEYVDDDYQMIGDVNDSENENQLESNNLENQTTNETDEQIDEYNCNLCGMNFESINEHVEQYHPGEDIIVDILDGNGTVMVKQETPFEASQESGDDCVSETNPLDDEMIVYGEEGMETDSSSIDQYVNEKEPECYTLDDGTSTIINASSTQSNRKTTKAGGETYTCSYCSEVFTTLKSWSSHLLSMHGEEITTTLNKKTGTQTSKKVTRTNKQTVNKKNEEASGSGSQVHGPSNKDHSCSICNTIFYSAKSLKLHARMHLPVKSKTMDETTEHDMDMLMLNDQETIREKFYCGICGKHYDKTFEEVHVQMHNGEEKFNCGICNKVFANEENIKMHMNAHQETRVIKTKAELNNKKLPYGCQYCGKEFARPHEKVKHERVHTGEKPYECELCGKCFRVSYCLTIHMRTHTDARPYVCPHCNKRFKAQSVYNHHLLTHGDERNYKCPFCPKTFKTSVQLSGHKNSHTKPFTCTECNRPFGSLYAVRAHMESHKRTNHNLKHICDICGAKYARRFALNDHIKEQHKDVQVVQIVDPLAIDKGKSASIRKPAAKRTKTVQHYEVIISDEQEVDVNDESILPNMVEQEITISEIEHFENEEEVSDIHWLK